MDVSKRSVSKPIGFICKMSEKRKRNKIKYKLIDFGLFKAEEKIKHKKRSG